MTEDKFDCFSGADTIPAVLHRAKHDLIAQGGDDVLTGDLQDARIAVTWIDFDDPVQLPGVAVPHKVESLYQFRFGIGRRDLKVERIDIVQFLCL